MLPEARMLDDMVAIALDAGGAILAMRPGDIVATPKADGSPLTQADLAANEAILKGLSEKFTGIPVITEEGPPDATETNTRYVFIVDPLDGTKDFLSGNGEYTVNIALLDGAGPLAGVVYAPVLGLIYAGMAGQGARRASVTYGVVGEWQDIATVKPAQKLRAVTSRSHPSPLTQKYLDGCDVDDFTPIGSSLKFCVIAAGEADIYPRMGSTMEWDTAAGHAILRAAGGTVVTLDGKTLRYNKRNAAGEHIFENPWFIASGSFDALADRWRSRYATELAASRGARL